MRILFSQTFGRGRRAAILLNVVFMVALAMASSVLVVYLAGFTDLRKRYDLTRAGTYTLSQETVGLLEDLDRDVEIITVFDPVVHRSDPNGVLLAAMEYVKDLLQEYRVRSKGRLSVENLDPRQDDVRVIDLYREYSLRSYNVAIVRSKDNRRILNLVGDLADIDVSQVPFGGIVELRGYRAEEALSSAVYEVIHERRSKVYAITGHGERSIENGAPTGASEFKAAIVRDNMIVEPLSLYSTRFIPNDADLVVLLGPEDDLVPEEVAAIEEYLRVRKGRLLVAIDPRGTRSLDGLWQRLGLQFERNIICHSQKGTLLGSSPAEQWISRSAPGDYGRHPITEALINDDLTTVVILNGAVSPTEQAVTRFTSLLLSHPESWGDHLQGDEPGNFVHEPRTELAGQRTFAAALEPGGEYEGSRVVFVAGSAWISNVAMNSQPGNLAFARRSVAWLTGKKRSIRLPPRTPVAARADLLPEDYDEIFRYVVIYLPLAGLLLSLLVWMARRN